MPAYPNGMNGSQFVTSTLGPATTKKIKTAANFTKTKILLTVTLSRVPRISRIDRNIVIKIAGKLISPPSAVGVVKAAGRKS